MGSNLPSDVIETVREITQGLTSRLHVSDERAMTKHILQQVREKRLLWPFAMGEGDPHKNSLVEPVRIIYELARVSGSAGLIVAMHMSQALTLLRHKSESSYFGELVEQLIARQSLIASGTSEKGVGGDALTSLCTIENQAHGVCSLEKHSPNISYLDLADVVLVTALNVKPNGVKEQVLIALKREQIETDAGDAESLLGMRGILNRPYRLKARFTSEAIFDEPYAAIARVTMTPAIHLFWCALWSGLAAAVLSKARAALGTERQVKSEAATAKAAHFSRLMNKHYTMNALIRDATAQMSSAAKRPSISLVSTAREKRLKVVCSELLDEICQGALGLIGLPGYAERGALSIATPVRDALSAQILVSNHRLIAANAEIERYLEENL